MMNIDSNTRLIDLTLGQLIEQLMNLFETKQKPVAVQPEKRNLVHGIAGIARLYNCSLKTANRIKKSGKINEAITQHGRYIITDADKALSLYNKKYNRHEKNYIKIPYDDKF